MTHSAKPGHASAGSLTKGPQLAQSPGHKPSRPTTVWGVCGVWHCADHNGGGSTTDAAVPGAKERASTARIVPVPARLLRPTAGSVTYANGRATDYLPLCVQFAADGKCSRGAHCPDLHGDGAFVRHYVASTAASAAPVCCAECGDPFAQRTVADAPELSAFVFDAVAIHTAALATSDANVAPARGRTADDNAFEDERESVRARELGEVFAKAPSLREVPISRLGATAGIAKGEGLICSLHASGECPMHKDCHRLHLCRGLHAELLSAVPSGHVVALRPRLQDPLPKTLLRRTAQLADDSSTDS